MKGYYLEKHCKELLVMIFFFIGVQAVILIVT